MQHTCSSIALNLWQHLFLVMHVQLYAMLTVLVFNDPMSHNY